MSDRVGTITWISGPVVRARGSRHIGMLELVEVGDERVWEELNAVLQGMSANQETTFERHEEAVQHGDHEHPARDRKFRIRVTAVKERDLPPLDDELAKRVSPDFETAEQLREAIVLRLRSVKQDERREARQRALLDQLRERHPLELPQGVVRREVEGLVQDYAEGLAHWRAREFSAAAECFGRGAKEDRAAFMFRDRARALADSPPAADWEPVRSLQEK